MKNWDDIKYFTAEEFADPLYPGSGVLIHFPLVIKLDHLRECIKCPIITHWAVGGCVDVNGVHGHSATVSTWRRTSAWLWTFTLTQASIHGSSITTWSGRGLGELGYTMIGIGMVSYYQLLFMSTLED